MKKPIAQWALDKSAKIQGWPDYSTITDDLNRSNVKLFAAYLEENEPAPEIDPIDRLERILAQPDPIGDGLILLSVEDVERLLELERAERDRPAPFDFKAFPGFGTPRGLSPILDGLDLAAQASGYRDGTDAVARLRGSDEDNLDALTILHTFARYVDFASHAGGAKK